MIRRLPILPTIIVIAVAAIMVWLGFWQLGRADEKAALIANYEKAIADNETVVSAGFADPDSLFRKAAFLCEEVSSIRQTAGRNQRGQSGWVYVARCKTGGARFHEPIVPTDYVIETVDVALGWSAQVRELEWGGGQILGRVISPGDEWGKVVADPPISDLESLAKPDPKDLPNNHLAYAGQWFFFALTAMVIYGFALRPRLRKKP